MNELLQKLAQLGPALGAGLAGNGDGMAAFMEGYQKTMAQLEAQKNRSAEMGMRQDELTMRQQDRDQVLARQAEQDRIAAADRARRQGIESLQVPGQLAEMGGMQESPEDAQRLIESLMPKMMELFGQEANTYGQPALEMATRTITGRQKKQVGDFVEAALKTAFVADNADADPEIVSLPAHIAKVIGKPSAKLSELQQFAQLPVGKPAAKKETPAPFNLSPGQTRFDGQGKRIASLPDRPKATGDSTPDQVFVVRDGKVVPITKGTAQPGDVPYSARTQNDSRPVGTGDAGKMADVNEALKLANQLEFKPEDTGIVPSLGAAAPDFVTNATGFGTGAKQRNGMIALVKQIIGKGLEGGVLRKEDEYKYARILPTISDPPDVVQTKITMLKTVLDQKRTTILESLKDAGYDTSRYEERGAPGGGTVEYVRGPDGKLVRK